MTKLWIIMSRYHLRHRSKYTLPTYPPLIDLTTFCSNSLRFCLRTSAASVTKREDTGLHIYYTRRLNIWETGLHICINKQLYRAAFREMEIERESQSISVRAWNFERQKSKSACTHTHDQLDMQTYTPWVQIWQTAQAKDNMAYNSKT